MRSPLLERSTTLPSPVINSFSSSCAEYMSRTSTGTRGSLRLSQTPWVRCSVFDNRALSCFMASPLIKICWLFPKQIVPHIKPQLILHFEFGPNHLDSEAPSRHPGNAAFRDAHRFFDSGEVNKER